MDTQPSLFLSHGSPMLALAEDDFTEALQGFARAIPRPKAIVVISAHGLSEGRTVEIDASAHPKLLYDFGGFPPALYQMEYPCPGSPELAVKISSLVSAAGFQAMLSQRGLLDHGVWIPLRVAFPEASIPVVQVSMPYPSRPEDVLRLGQALAPLRKEGVLLIGSGGAVHNLRLLSWHEKNSEGAPWAREFQDWVKGRLAEKDIAGLLRFDEEAPHAEQAHPTPEHFYPLYFTLGAALPGDRAALIYEGVQYQTLSMLSFALVSPQAPV